MPRPLARPSALLVPVLALCAALAGCEIVKDNPESIDIQPAYPVRYATARISPAVVQLDVLSEHFSGGQSRPERSIGSGFIIDKEGHVLTNFHVAGRAKRIDATLANQEHVRATLIGSDHWTDLALVQLDMDEIRRKNLTFEVAPLGKSSEVVLGQPVMAVGTPYGLSRTITAGIISQTDRYFEETNIDQYETGWFNNWLQTDAAINPGNSGGPLINLKGEVIGINTRGISEGNNLGFAIPIDTAREVYPELLKNKKVSRSYIGVVLQPLQDLEKHYDIHEGVLISNIERSSPAELAGVQIEDILLAVNGRPVSARFPEQLAAVRKMMAEFPIGSKLELTVRRGTNVTTAVATATTAPAAVRGEVKTIAVTTDRLESAITDEKAITAWGMTVRDLTRAYLRDQRLLVPNQPRIEGVLVVTLRVGMPAAEANLQAGDIIQGVDGKKVTSVDELQAAVDAWSKNPHQIAIDGRHPPRAQFTLSLKP